MKGYAKILAVCLAGCFFAAGCARKESNPYLGPVYPATSEVTAVFQPTQAPRQCVVFAELLVRLPGEMTGQAIRDAVQAEAQKRGADKVLIGQSRQSQDDEGLGFLYYGPEREYLCNEQWHGWKFGYSEWSKQQDWVNIGFEEWGNQKVFYGHPIMMQVAFLKCQ